MSCLDSTGWSENLKQDKGMDLYSHNYLHLKYRSSPRKREWHRKTLPLISKHSNNLIPKALNLE